MSNTTEEIAPTAEQQLESLNLKLVIHVTYMIFALFAGMAGVALLALSLSTDNTTISWLGLAMSVIGVLGTPSSVTTVIHTVTDIIIVRLKSADGDVKA